ncbi:MAG TPA: RlpA-like double-psi beta-barrel domain-containing protein [Solirubrobacterales bacterium]|nr:RlpA-like double-psi beta-barrel domain-containing protein [Solirubrobacterales bacterium]
MESGIGRPRAANENRRRAQRGALRSRPDRVAFWALALAVIVLVAAAVSAQAQSGGVSPGGGGTEAGSEESTECADAARFGSRVLKRPDCGDDVRTLNWILRSKKFQRGVSLARNFDDDTAATVRRFQRRRGLPVNGILRPRPRKELVRSLARERATWYGPGFWGNRTACGQKLGKRTRGVAHRRLPCGTRVVVGHKGRFVRTKVIDRGPYAHGANWDLTRKIARELRFDGVGKVRVAKIR